MAPGFFDVDERLKRLSDLGDQLETYGRVVDFEAFRPDLEKALSYSSGAHGGRPPYDPVMMAFRPEPLASPAVPQGFRPCGDDPSRGLRQLSFTAVLEE